MHLRDLFRNIDIIDKNVDDETEFTSVSADSRTVSRGGVFVCLDGVKCRGECFICDALSSGVGAVVVENKAGCLKNIPFVAVNDTREAFAHLCSNLEGSPGEKMNLFAVTGTNGKTTVANMLGEILKKSGEATEVIGTITGDMTTPDPDVLYPLLRKFADNGVKNVVMEASSHALALKKLVPLRFCVGIFTNLTKDHTDFHIDMERYFAAKASLFDLCDKAVVNIDDMFGKRLGRIIPSQRFWGVSVNGCSDMKACFTAQNVVFSFDGVEYDIARDCGADVHITSTMPWKFNVYNTLCAASAALSYGINDKIVQSTLSEISGVKGRLERIIPGGSYRGYPYIYIDYAHTPDALCNALASLRGVMELSDGLLDGRLTVLFGCGGDRDCEKRPMMGAIASRMADFVIVTSDNSRSEQPAAIISEICKGVDSEKPYIVVENRRDAIIRALDDAREGDVLLLAGKGHEEYMVDSEGKHYFSEKKIIEEYYRIAR